MVKCVVLYFLCQHHLEFGGGDRQHYEIKDLMHSGATLVGSR